MKQPSLTRRRFLRGLGFGMLGLSLADLMCLRAAARDRDRPKAKACILIWLFGGPSHIDTWDMKPNAAAEYRGEFKPISTTVPGLQVCEHLPRTAKWMHRCAVVRSVNHKAGCHNCLPSYTGFAEPMPDQHPRDSDPPSMGSVVEWLRVREGRSGAGVFPDYVYLPCWLGWGQVFRRAGPYGGFLGKRFDALTTEEPS